MEKISKKHWIAFLILFLFEVIMLVFAPYIAGYTITFISICLCLGLIRFYLREPLAEYGLFFKKIHTIGILHTFAAIYNSNYKLQKMHVFLNRSVFAFIQTLTGNFLINSKKISCLLKERR